MGKVSKSLKIRIMNQKEVLEFDGFRVERESFLALSFAFIACTIVMA